MDVTAPAGLKEARDRGPAASLAPCAGRADGAGGLAMSSFRTAALSLAQLAWASAALGAAATSRPGADGAGPATRPRVRSAWPATRPVSQADKIAKRREKYVDFYMRAYGKSLEHTDWITRAMAVISLSWIDDPRVTEMILDVLERPYVRGWRARIPGDDKSPPARPSPSKPNRRSPLHGLSGSYSASAWRVGNQIVRVIAWEALHARNASLTAEQRKRWIAATIELARTGQFRGALRAGMLRVLIPEGPTQHTYAIFKKLFAETNALYPGDVEVLRAMREALAAWQDVRLVRLLIAAIARSHHDAPRADWLLRAFEADIPKPEQYAHKGTRALWAAYHGAWKKWLAKQAFKPPRPGSLPPYKGTSKLLDPPEVIDPDEAKWHKDLELPRLHLEPLDVAFAVDSTGSMMSVIEWIKRDVHRMLKAFALISREPRIGVTFYRDKGDEYVTRTCPLTDNGAALSRAIRTARAGGGGDAPEAVLQALAVALRKQPWSRMPNARKVIVLVGDAPPHKEDMRQVERLVKAAAARGFTFYCIKARRSYGREYLQEFDRIAEWGRGKCASASFQGWAGPYGHSGVGVYADGPTDPFRRTPVRRLVPVRLPDGRVVVRPETQPATAPADDADHGRADRILLREVLASILTRDYHDRVRPFINVVLEYVETPVKEVRQVMPPRTRIPIRRVPVRR